MMIIFVIYFIGVIAMALHLDHPSRSWEFGFVDRLGFMLLWPVFISMGLILLIVIEILIFVIDHTLMRDL